MKIIVACDLNGGIGINNKLPWPTNKEDLSRFYKLTTKSIDYKKNVIIMGRKTWDSLPYKPLKNRINIILSQKGIDISNYDPYLTKTFNSKEAVYKYLNENNNINDIFVIGGKKIYDLFYNDVNFIHLTLIKNCYKCDRYLRLENIYNDYKISYKHNTENLIFLNMEKK
jgi:dihydrofolate reductase